MDNAILPSTDDLILKNASKPFTVNSVRIEGLVHTNHAFLQQITWPLLEAKTLAEVMIGSRNIADKLSAFGIFKSVNVLLDSPDKGKTGVKKVDVIYTVVESPRLFAKTGVDVGSTEGSMVT
jgi:outer membrane protein insertion porin family